MNRVIIIGAGISGLATAWWLHKKFPQSEILIFDKRHSPGGSIYTEYNEGFFFDLGPKGFLTRGEGEYTLKLIQELDLNDALIFSNSAAKKRFIHYRGKTRRVSLWTLLREGLLSTLVKDLCASRYSEDSSVEAFLKRHASPSFTNCILNPMVTAIRAGHSHALSTHMAFPSLAQYEAETGSLLRSYIKNFSCVKKTKSPGYLASLQPSLGLLVDVLTKKIPAVWKFSSSVTRISSSSIGASVSSSEGQFSADLVIYTGSTHQLPNLINIPGIEILGEKTLPWNLSSISLGWRFPKFSLPHGYGVLFTDEPPLLGIVWNSQIFPQTTKGKASLSLLIEGRWHTAEAHALAIAVIAKYLNITQKPDAFSLFSPQEGMPQHNVGFIAAKTQVLPRVPKNIKLVGQNIVGPGINRCIASAYHTVAVL
ncbi:protoporphyrinogen oxidase [Candidatus Chlamydia sanziniae]|uniref:Coproporphyrinogen III oxidase n=1 Tax=Candidatus Chlamydia sanziniae TaxID=1806891 RepID=A0A1A9HXN9_9CHLA|nr:protoporphyrinogen oxidase [Candidatus Chlamydia sanziniae]ANH78686.1 Protoporphyrinogen IX oxidase, aerobic, HemY [Candidatus Chlamydia sanziniae]